MNQNVGQILTSTGPKEQVVTGLPIGKLNNLDKRVTALEHGGGSGAVWGVITGTLSDQTDLQAALDAKASLASVTTETENAQSGTTYTFVLGDAGKMVTSGNGSATTFTVPANASVAFPVGTRIDLLQIGAGKLTIAASGGVTINSQSGNLSLAAQYVGATLWKQATNTWYLMGNLIA